MRILTAVFAAIVLATVATASAQTQTAMAPTIVMPDKTPWTAGTGPFMGAQVAVLSGDPTKSGPYVVRIKLPANTMLPAHFHGDTENVTVISGTFYVGLGDKADPNKLTALPAGTFCSVPANLHHYAATKSEPVVIQIEGMGPSSMTNVSGKM